MTSKLLLYQHRTKLGALSIQLQNVWLTQVFTQNFALWRDDPVKGNAIPLQAWTGPEGSRSLRLPDFKTIGT
jgi:hypothetical protein